MLSVTKVRLVTLFCIAAVLFGPHANARESLSNPSDEQIGDSPATGAGQPSDVLPGAPASPKANDVRVKKAFSLEVGRFKLPFGHEELTGETNLDFAYRSLAARVLSPSRDPGVMAHGRLWARTLEYHVGYFTRGQQCPHLGD